MNSGIGSCTFLIMINEIMSIMATKTELRILAKARLKEAQILFEAKRYDAAPYQPHRYHNRFHHCQKRY